MVAKLLVLMWKHFVVRRRRFIHTPIEYLSPIVLFIVFFVFRNNINPVSRYALQRGNNIQYTESVDIDTIESPETIFYTPDTRKTRLLMHAVGVKLKLPKGDGANGIGYFPIANAAAIPKMQRDYAVLIFYDMNEEDKHLPELGGITNLPERLNYTLRTRLPYKSIDNKMDEESLGRHPSYGTNYEPFIKLQWAVDSSFLELKTGKVIGQRLSLQEFPYATSEKNEIIDVVCDLVQMVCYLSLVLVFVFLVSRLLDERITGIREMIQMVGVSSTLLHLSQFLNVAPAGVAYSVVGAVLLRVGENPILRHSNLFLIWLLLALNFVAVIALAYATSYMLKKAQYGVTFASIMYVIYRLLSELAYERVPAWALTPCGLLPFVPSRWFWLNVAAVEKYGTGLTFSNMGTSHNNKSMSVFSCYVMLIMQIVLYALIARYLEFVNPGPYGQALPWNFCLQRDFWNKKKVTPDEESEELEREDTTDPRFFEPPPDTEAGIKVVNVSKMFPKHKALSNVSLNAYKGEITLLLGHNGAGKTTLMSIISGLLKATEGKVFVEGLDTVTQKEMMRKHLGLCPQHNLFFSDLTILEHVMFFTLLKRGSFAEARQSSMALLDQLGLASKANNNSGQLSGGMKRRLQLACALAGDADVLVLDEPTAGLDVETRRELWDLLLSLRGQRTVLLSTHFMEEADALGDRVAALHSGRLRCFATPMHLKRAFGTGYRLTITTLGVPNERAISALVTAHVPDASVKEKSLNVISYNLPAARTSSFPRLFNDLESKKSELDIDSIGVGITTLEEVFIKLCSDLSTSFVEDEVDGQTTEPMLPVYDGMWLYLRQFWTLFKRQFKFLWSNKISFSVLQVVLPLFVIISVTFMTNNMALEQPSPDARTAMDLDLYKDMKDRSILYTINNTQLLRTTFNDLYPGVKARATTDVADEILQVGQLNILDYNKYLIGIELNDTDARILFTTVRHHAAPVAANVLANLLAMELLGAPDTRTVTTYNQPLEQEHATAIPKLSKSLIGLVTWAAVVVFVTMATLINAAMLPCGERLSGARHLHVLAGARPALPWAASLAAHMVTYTGVLLVPTLIAAAAIEADHTINQTDFLGTLFVALFVGTLAFLSFTYLMSFYLSYNGASVMLVAAITLFGFITPLVSTASDLLEQKKDRGFTYYLVEVLGCVMPPHAFTSAVMKAAVVASNNAEFTLHPESTEKRKCYFCLEKDAPGISMLVLFVQFVVYMSLVIVTQYGTFRSVWDRMWNARYSGCDPTGADEHVRAEIDYVKKVIEHPKQRTSDALLAYNLHKNYPRIFGKSCNAVKGVSFSVKKGECFGLLGVNGAGKSTIFKMLTGVEHPTRGNVFSSGYYLNHTYGEYLRSLGYCPQFFGLDEFLSGADNMCLLLTLRGLAPEDVTRVAKAWIEAVGLEKYSGRVVSSYSGGCARRLSAAAAMCGGARVLLLDEPTAGVDVTARRRLWGAVRRAARASAVVISSHSMDETEALCGRIAVMAAGRLRALGSAGALRAAYAAGYAVVLRVHAPAAGADVTDSAADRSELTRLKNTLHKTFNCTLKDEHKTMLHYHIDDNLSYSELFASLERLHADFPHLIQDYSVTETTLEEVFLSFARETPNDGPTPV